MNHMINFFYKQRSLLVGLTLIWAFWLSGCAAGSRQQSQVIALSPVVSPTGGASEEMGALGEKKDFRLAPGDEIEIKFYYLPDLSDSMRIRPDGRINLSLISSVVAAGKTPEELEDELTELYRDKVEKPELSVVVRDLSQRFAFVDGEVMMPKAVPLGYVGMNVAGALAQAGGARRSASLENVVLIRKSQDVIEAHALDLSGDKRFAAGMMEMEPGDIVYVPMNKISKIGDFVDLYIDGLMPNFIRFNGTYNLGSLDGGSRSVVISGGD